MSEIRVALADDHPIVLAGLKALIESTGDMRLVGAAADGQAALDVIKAETPDVAVIDVSMPKLNGFRLAQAIAGELPAVKVLVLTVHEDRAYLDQMLQCGVRGYLLKRSAAEDLLRAIRAVVEGGLYIDPAMASKLLSTANAPGASPQELSGREEAVLRLAARGFSSKEAAARLLLSIKTVETYKARGAEKLGLHSRAEIVRYGAHRGWLDESS
jgi:DNA-binding NarL/FixJ family response regulator